MDDDDEIQSHASPTPNGQIAVTVAAPPPNCLTLALPIQHHRQKTPSSGGGREDCWSEGATAVLIGAWGERYLELSRGNLKQKHWKDVADIVSSREDITKTPKTDIQCKNRIDTVKKKYKVEKSKISSGGGPSKWRFFDRLDELIGPTAKMNSTPPRSSAAAYIDSNKVPMGIPFGVASSFQKKPSSKRPPVVDSDDDESEPENSMDSSDGLPPDTTRKRPRIQRMANKKISDGNRGNSIRELTRAVLKFGEAYQQAETAKLQQLVDMEKQRMKFAKDLELQRMQHFMKTQLELSQLKNRRTGTDSNNQHGISKNNDTWICLRPWSVRIHQYLLVELGDQHLLLEVCQSTSLLARLIKINQAFCTTKMQLKVTACWVVDKVHMENPAANVFRNVRRSTHIVISQLIIRLLHLCFSFLSLHGSQEV